MSRARVVILRNPAKPDAELKLASLVMRKCADVVATGIAADAAELSANSRPRHRAGR